MAINLKAKETLIQVGELKGKYRYVLSTELYNKLPESKVIKEAALRSGVSRGVMQACWDAAGEVIKTWSTEGHSVAIPGLGTMRFGVRAKSVATVGEVAGSLITTRRVIFTPNVDIKDELQRTPIQITCIDRNGKVVKNVTSGDSGDVEDPDKDPNGGGTNPGGTGNGGAVLGTESPGIPAAPGSAGTGRLRAGTFGRLERGGEKGLTAGRKNIGIHFGDKEFNLHLQRRDAL